MSAGRHGRRGVPGRRARPRLGSTNRRTGGGSSLRAVVVTRQVAVNLRRVRAVTVSSLHGLPAGCATSALFCLRWPDGARRRVPGDAKQENERQAEEQRRWACGGEAEASRGHGSARAGERLVQGWVALPGLQASGYQHRRAQHDGGARAQYPRRGDGGAAVVGVVDEADHRGAHGGDGGGEGQVAEHPLGCGRTGGPGVTLPCTSRDSTSAKASRSRMRRSLTSTSPGAGWTLNRKAHWMPGTLPALPRPDSAASPLPSPARSLSGRCMPT
jgi:hypothetical protein